MMFTPIATGGGVWTIDRSSNRLDNATFYVDAAGYYHRDDGPSYLVDDMGACAWHQHGVLHRSGGPAFEDASDVQWWLNGVQQPDDAAYWATRGPIF